MGCRAVVKAVLCVAVLVLPVQIRAYDSAQSAVDRLRYLYRIGDVEGGCCECPGMLRKYPESRAVWAWSFLHRASYAYGEQRRAPREEMAAEARAAIGEDPADPWQWFALTGVLWFIATDEVLSSSENVVALMPDHPDAIWMRARSLYRRRRYEECIAFVDVQLGRALDLTDALTAKGKALLVQSRNGVPGKEAEGLAVFAGLRGRDSTNAAAYHWPGWHLLQVKRFAEAYPLLKQAAALAPEAFFIHYNVWDAILGRNDWSEARKSDEVLKGIRVATQARGGRLRDLRYLHRSYDRLGLVDERDVVGRRIVDHWEQVVAEKPSDTGAYEGLWDAVQRSSGLARDSQIARIEASVDQLLERRRSDAEALGAVSGIYARLRLSDRSEKIKARILEEFPETGEAEWVLVSQYRAVRPKPGPTQVEDPEATARYRRRLREFLARPRHHDENALGDAYRSLFLSLAEDEGADPDEVLRTAQGMARYEGMNQRLVFARGPLALLERTQHWEEAERIARQGIEETKYARKQIAGAVHDALGWILLKQGRLDEAEEMLSRAYELTPESPLLLYHLGALHEAKGNVEQAEMLYRMGAVSQSPIRNNPNHRALKALYERRHGDLTGFNDSLAAMRQTDSRGRKQEILATRLPGPTAMPAFTLKDLSGAGFSSERLEGKVAVINFWGIWCGWCVKELPDFQELYEKYRSDPDVAVLSINSKDPPLSVAPWMQEKRYTFPVLLDDAYVRRAGVSAFPTTWFIDRQGRVAFEQRGWTKELVEEFSWRIEALRGVREAR